MTFFGIASAMPTAEIPTAHWYLQLFSDPQYVGLNCGTRPQHLEEESRHVDTNAYGQSQKKSRPRFLGNYSPKRLKLARLPRERDFPREQLLQGESNGFPKQPEQQLLGLLLALAAAYVGRSWVCCVLRNVTKSSAGKRIDP